MIGALRLGLELPCPLCPRSLPAGKDLCSKCEGEFRPTPLRAWRAVHDVSLLELQEDTGLSKRTVLRADAGERMSHEAARALAKRTGLHWRVFRPKTSAPAGAGGV
ncbi:hypothetical protein [Sandaracinus amylolyticus]|uniref:hypothetical protein n=1 Tax=Sandaracinus amylolyticus TaxID=927083 RepID=UPI001F3D18B7|nr:hypothetical protein [Sandaracinus amylolyticus]UJR81474.1 Hypothetical protein I5071_35330 [Sandaracinus amylolyticus]